MRLQTRTVKAEDIPDQSFVYDPRKKRFFYVDFVEHEEKKTTLIFEPDANPDNWIYWGVKNDRLFQVVELYKVTPKTFYS